MKKTLHITALICVLVTFDVIIGQQQQQPAYCPDDETEAIMGVGYRCIQTLWAKADGVPYQMFQVSFWAGYCRAQYEFDGCMNEVFEGCTPSYIGNMKQRARQKVQEEFVYNSFYPLPGICNGTGGVRENIVQLYDAPGSICKDSVYNSLAVCMEEWLDGISTYSTYDGDMRRNTTRNNTDELVLDMYRCGIGNIIPQCNDQPTKTFAKFIMDQTVPPDVRNKLSGEDFRNNLKTYEILSTRRHTVGVFGDPHLLAIWLKELTTCEIEENQAYLVNSFFAINATSSPKNSDNTQASSITQVVVRFFDKDGAVAFQYIASSGNLPPRLSNRATSGQAGSIRVRMSVVGSRIAAFRIDSLAVLMEISKWNNYYSIGVRMSEDMYRKSYGLLIDGCPRENRISRDDGREETGVCVEACVAVNNTENNDFRSACEYDCRASGSVQAAEMTRQFKETVESLQAGDESYSLVEPPETWNSSPPMSVAAFWMTIISLLLAVTS